MARSLAQEAAPSGDPDLGNLALEFLHTSKRNRDGWVDALRTPRDVVDWLVRHVDPSEYPERVEGALTVSEARILFDEARRLRDVIGALVEGHHGGRVPEWAIFGLNRLLAANASTLQLADSRNGPTLVVLRGGASPLAWLGPVALAAAHLVTAVPRERLRPCASSRCGAWFVDTSKGGRRRWCSMATCGNREKAAAHRAKSAPG